MKFLKNPILILAIAAIVSAAFYFVRTEIYSDWQPTEGTITSVEVRSGRKGRSIVDYYYTYCVDGREYSGFEGFSSSSGKHEYDVGQTKEIWYDPHEPSSSRFIKPGPELYVYIPLFLALPIAMWAADTRKERKKRI